MTKLSVLGQTFVAGVAIASGMDQLQKPITSERRIPMVTKMETNETSRLSNNGSADSSSTSISTSISSNNNNDNSRVTERMEESKIGRFNEPELLEYFENGDQIEDDVKIKPTAPLSHPEFYFEDSIWKHFDDREKKSNVTENQKRSVFSSTYRRLTPGYIDDNGQIDDVEYNPFGYSNYHEAGIREHDEKLIADDDELENMMKTDDDRPSQATPTPSPTELQTSAPTVLEETVWTALDVYLPRDDVTSESSDSSSSSENDDEDEDGGITDTELLADRPINTIMLKVSLGVVHYDNMEKQDTLDVLGMVLRTMTMVLNEHSNVPFMVQDNLESFRKARGRNRELRPHTASSFTDNFPRTPQQRGIDDNVNPELELKKILDVFDPDSDDGRPKMAKIVLENCVVYAGEQQWWEVSAIYSVWKNPAMKPNFIADRDTERRPGQRELGGNDKTSEEQQRHLEEQTSPVKNQTILKKIERILGIAMDTAIETDVFWGVLQTISYGNQDMVLDRDMVYADEMGMMDVQIIGDEYDMTSKSCRMDRPSDDETCPEDMMGGPVIGSKGPPSDDDQIPQPPGGLDDMEFKTTGTYPEVIAESLSEIEWGTREWVGLTVLINSIVFTLGLMVSAHVVFERRKKKSVWGTRLTPNGIDDILKVGWRVTEQPSPRQQDENFDDDGTQNLAQEEQQQLYLQIYDKGRGEGYNDENSLLRGGVEQELFAPPVTPPPEPPHNQATDPSNPS